MIKFEEHEGKLFKMLDEPVPLKENDENVLVRFITHGVIGEYVMEHWLDCNQENVPIFVKDVDSDGDVTVWIENGNEHICCPFPMFEIIGTLVADGSAEWALYQMMQGEKVTKGHLEHTYLHYDARPHLQCISEYICGTLQIMVSPEIWIKTADKDGWQIYAEPKPLLADAGIGDIVKTNLGDWLQIVDTPCLRFGHDECHRTHDGLYWDECGVCDVDSTYRLVAVEPLAPEGTAEWALQMMKLGNKVRNRDWDGGIHEKSLLYCQLIGETIKYNEGCSAFDVCLSDWEAPYIKNTGWQLYEPKEEPPKEPDNLYLNIKPSNPADWCFDKKNLLVLVDDSFKGIVGENVTREQVVEIAKLLTEPKPESENIIHGHIPADIVIHIGCLSGTVEDLSYAEDGRFWFIGKKTERCPGGMYAILYEEMLDAPTRELVEGLLKAQEEEK